MEVCSNRRLKFLLSAAALCVLVSGCKKQVATTPPTHAAPAPSAAQPTVTLNASPQMIKSGDTVTLTWTSTDATDADIEPGVGKVALQGSTPVNPTDSTTYTMTVTGPGGSATATARVTVGGEAPPPTTGGANMSELFEQNVRDAYFDFNKADIRADAQAALRKDAEFFRSYPQIRVTIEGHCDERGSTEYNIGLGERRAQAAKNYLVSLGISAERMDTVSWGKERPFCTEHTEQCWQQNRRAHFVAAH
ncbi:MAG: peptidoglycan-associated lipoprotein Pal [Candidatus Acidiferrales bacterium]